MAHSLPLGGEKQPIGGIIRLVPIGVFDDSGKEANANTRVIEVMTEAGEQAFQSAARVLSETGCAAVKLEGGVSLAPTIAFLAARGIPVMAHVGLTPQSVMTLGGFKTQGRDKTDWPAIEADAVAVADAGAFAVVLEGMVEPLAEKITHALPVPTIGIGASAKCDGQILVLEDLLGLSERVPRFVRRFGDLRPAAEKAIEAYAAAVADRTFPGEAEVYQPKA